MFKHLCMMLKFLNLNIFYLLPFLPYIVVTDVNYYELNNQIKSQNVQAL